MDVDSPEAVETLVTRFYEKVLDCERLQPFFDGTDLSQNIVNVRAYWEKFLLRSDRYHRHMVNAHRRVAALHTFHAADFRCWLELFVATVDEQFSGPRAERAKHLAYVIAGNLERILTAPG